LGRNTNANSQINLLPVLVTNTISKMLLWCFEKARVVDERCRQKPEAQALPRFSSFCGLYSYCVVQKGVELVSARCRRDFPTI